MRSELGALGLDASEWMGRQAHMEGALPGMGAAGLPTTERSGAQPSCPQPLL